jgi:SprT protein
MPWRECLAHPGTGRLPARLTARRIRGILCPMHLPPAAPLTGLQHQARAATLELLRRATAPGRHPPAVEIRFDLRGQAAGQVRLTGPGRALIRYNLQLLMENRDHFLAHTVPHEVAHLLAWQRYGPHIRPHGPEWRSLMLGLGADPSRCHTYDTSRIRTRRLQRHTYHCACREYALTSIRHNRIRRGQRYLCRDCGQPLHPGRPPAESGAPVTD